MEKLLEKIVEIEDQSDETAQSEDILPNIISGVRIGTIESINKSGRLLVDYPDNPYGLIKAQSIIDVTSGDVNRKILLAFENNDPMSPIIIGFIQNKLPYRTKKNTLNKDNIKDVFVDSRKIEFNAETEIVLRCGNSSLIMKKDGKIIIKGKELVSRASKVNKIKGAAVKIN